MMRSLLCWPAGVMVWAFGAVSSAADDRPTLSLPIVCEPHRTCFIQNYVDLDPGPGVRDYSCGTATYDQHSGTDFRILSAEAAKSAVPVVAAADGKVSGIRDGVADVFYKKANAKDVAGRECGNGVIIDHGNGWETQYCHLRQGSVHVTKGQDIKRGDRLGDVGFSGMAQFSHLHLTVKHDGKIVDPFLPDSKDGACLENAKGPGLWEPAAAAAFPYKNGELINAEFVGAPPDVNTLEVNHRDVTAFAPDSPALLLYGRFINLLKADKVQLVATGPDGALFSETATPLKRAEATYIAYAGKRRGNENWRPGRYEGRVELIREGGVIASTVVTIELK